MRRVKMAIAATVLVGATVFVGATPAHATPSLRGVVYDYSECPDRQLRHPELRLDRAAPVRLVSQWQHLPLGLLVHLRLMRAPQPGP
ncbi:hypothetical protein ACFQZ4_49355 [Catellatospora coxensis]